MRLYIETAFNKDGRLGSRLSELDFMAEDAYTQMTDNLPYSEERVYSARIGVPSNPHTKLQIVARTSFFGMKKVTFSVYPNDSGDREDSRRQNAEYKANIERAWNDAGFGVE